MIPIIDTIEISYRVSEETFIYIYTHLIGCDPLNVERYLRCKRLKQKFSCPEFYAHINEYIKHLPNGILNFYGYPSGKPLDPYCYISITVSPYLLINNTPSSVNLFAGTESNIDLFKRRYSEVMRSLYPQQSGGVEYFFINSDFSGMYDFDFVYLSRVDCSFNFMIAGDDNRNPDNRLASLYIFLLNACSRPYGKLKYSQQNTKFKYNQVRYTSNSLNVVIYDKFAQLSEKSNYAALDMLLDGLGFDGVLRYEVQILRKKLRSLIRANRYSNTNLLTEEFTRAVLLNYANKIFFTGSWRKKDNAINALTQSLKKSECSKCISLLDFIADKQSVRTALKSTTLSTSTIDKRFKNLSAANTQPYYIPVNKYRDYNLKNRLKNSGELPDIFTQLTA